MGLVTSISEYYLNQAERNQDPFPIEEIPLISKAYVLQGYLFTIFAKGEKPEKKA
jgi:hypothetical protein